MPHPTALSTGAEVGAAAAKARGRSLPPARTAPADPRMQCPAADKARRGAPNSSGAGSCTALKAPSSLSHIAASVVVPRCNSAAKRL